MKTRIRAALMMGAALAAMAACSTADGEQDPVGPTSVPASPEPSSSMDPEVQKAVAAYEAFLETSNEALRNPVGKGDPLPERADFSRWSYDPAESEAIVFMNVLASYNAEFRGSEPTSNVKVVAVTLDASPYPTVVLADCQVPRGLFVPYSRDSGKPLDLTDDENLQDPYLSDVEMISVDGRWGVRSAVAERKTPCQP